MDIASYLLELIETQKIVGINALGTLYKKKTPGRYDSETHSFLPPKYEIAFNSEVKEDQYLANFISEKKNISIESAHFYITEFVENIQTQLADHQQADFSPLGELKLINDEITLESSKTIEIGFASYGLPSVSTNQNSSVEPDPQPVYEEISEVNTTQEINENEEPTQPATGILDPLWKPSVINRYEYDDEDEDEEKGKSKWVRRLFKVMLTLLTIAAITAVLIYFLYPDLFYQFKNNLPEQTPTEAPSGGSVKIDSGSNPKNEVAVVHDSLKKNVVFTSVAKDSVTTPAISNSTVYEVIGSAMKTQKKVDEVISIFAKRGINAKKMESMPGRLIKVSLGTFTDYNLAKKFKDSLKIKLKNPDLYIQTIKPKN